MSESRCCVLVVTYNAVRWIERCLEALEGAIPLENVFILDNGSSDNTVLLIKEKSPAVNLEQSHQNLGFGAANNHLLKQCYDLGYDYFFLLNQDAYVEKETIARLLRFAQSHEKAAVISPIHKNGSGNDLDDKFRYYMRFNDLKKEKYTTVEFVNAAAWLLPKSTLEEVGLFHPFYFHYGEDRNYCDRVLYQGLEIAICKDAVIYHDREQRTDNVLKDHPKKHFHRESMRILLNPQMNNGVSLHLAKAIGRITRASRGHSVLYKIYFYPRSIIVHLMNFYRVWFFKKNNEPGLYLENTKSGNKS